jgi:membrane protease YdiL (CAAX protease family)
LSTAGKTAVRSALLAVFCAYLLAIGHAVAVRAAGGIGAVPLALFGTCQYLPALVVLGLEPSYLRRCRHLLRVPGDIRSLGIAYASAATAVAGCLVVAYLAGEWRVPLAHVAERYPLRAFVPPAVLRSRAYLGYLLVAGPVLHGLNALGEEVMWRGYVVDKLRAAGWPRARIVAAVGAAWALWHLPMILLGWDFPGNPAAGMATMVFAMIAWTAVMLRLDDRSDGLWPAVLMHALANALTNGVYDRAVDPGANPFLSPWGLVGGAMMLAFALASRDREAKHDLARLGPAEAS